MGDSLVVLERLLDDIVLAHCCGRGVQAELDKRGIIADHEGFDIEHGCGGAGGSAIEEEEVVSVVVPHMVIEGEVAI